VPQVLSASSCWGSSLCHSSYSLSTAPQAARSALPQQALQGLACAPAATTHLQRSAVACVLLRRGPALPRPTLPVGKGPAVRVCRGLLPECCHQGVRKPVAPGQCGCLILCCVQHSLRCSAVRAPGAQPMQQGGLGWGWGCVGGVRALGAGARCLWHRHCHGQLPGAIHA
jgi:hypothetical protein